MLPSCFRQAAATGLDKSYYHPGAGFFQAYNHDHLWCANYPVVLFVQLGIPVFEDNGGAANGFEVHPFKAALGEEIADLARGVLDADGGYVDRE